MKHENNELVQNGLKEKNIILKMHEVIKDGRAYMSETFITDKGMTVTVNIPILTPEQQIERDKEIEQSLIALYKKIVASGRGYIYDKVNDK